MQAALLNFLPPRMDWRSLRPTFTSALSASVAAVSCADALIHQSMQPGRRATDSASTLLSNASGLILSATAQSFLPCRVRQSLPAPVLAYPAARPVGQRHSAHVTKAPSTIVNSYFINFAGQTAARTVLDSLQAGRLCPPRAGTPDP